MTEIEITQEELDNIRKANTMLNKSEVMESIDLAFDDAIKHLKTRDSATQTIVGNMLTVLQGDLLKELKKLRPVVRK